ncbi:COG2887 RecB family exonuclease [Acidimicrobiia bacterium]
MALELPTSLSPSKVSSFTDCALAFRFASIDRIPQAPTAAMVKGTLVHSALERLFALDPAERNLSNAQVCLAEARVAIETDPEWIELALDDQLEPKFMAEASSLVDKYFQLEDPSTITPVGLEMQLEFDLDGIFLRGIIDRLEENAAGELIITDYKTGRAPAPAFQKARLGGVHFYSLLCERVLGRRPARVQLLFLGQPVVIDTVPTDQSTRQLENKLRAVWSAIETGCEREDFRPKPSKLCSWCDYQKWCPEFGGDPSKARAESEALREQAKAATAALTDGAAVALP